MNDLRLPSLLSLSSDSQLSVAGVEGVWRDELLELRVLGRSLSSRSGVFKPALDGEVNATDRFFLDLFVFNFRLGRFPPLPSDSPLSPSNLFLGPAALLVTPELRVEIGTAKSPSSESSPGS
jgi:hypothetical protein